jgi:TetR/AcrR family transcriptional regulator, fatty acid metabolism regulator protein
MLKRKDKILISAIELLSEEGVNGITTKNLAKLQEVTEPALYRQYTGKQDILNHIIEEYASFDDKIMNTIKQRGLKGKEGIAFYVKRFAELYSNYSELTTVMYSMDLYFYNEETRQRMKEILEARTSFLEGLMDGSKEEAGCYKLYDKQEMASMIQGIIFAQVYEWRMKEKAYSLEERLLSFVMRFF